MQVILLAGGRGRRLLPYTTVLPKPLMPVGDYSILEVILLQMKHFGLMDITISTGYLHELICAFLSTKKNLGLDIKIIHEDSPLGTIGPLHLIPDLEDSFLVMNGDILTDLNYQDLIEQHERSNATATIATYKREVHIDFGVIHRDQGLKIHSFQEKPVLNYEVSMGIYVFNKRILQYVPDNQAFGFDDLMKVLIERNEEVYSYPYDGFWLDIGRPDDYERSILEFEQNKIKFIP